MDAGATASPPSRPTAYRALVAVVAALTLLTALVVVEPTPARAAPSQVPDDLWVTNGRVKAVTQVGDHIYLGGNFNRIGPATGHGVLVDPGSGALSPSSPHVDGVVFAAASDGAGGWYLGGQFSHVNGVGRTNVAHVLADGTVSSWHPFTDGTVRAIVRTQDAVVIVGDFTLVRTLPRTRVAAVRPDTAVPLPGWDPAVNNAVHAVAVAGSRVILGGDFTSVDGFPIPRLASVDLASGTVDPLFNPAPNGSVRAVDVSADGSRVYAGGSFTLMGLVPRQRVAAIDAGTGAVDLTFAATANDTVRAVRAHPDGTQVLVGGEFSRLSGTARGRIGAVDASGRSLPWAASASGAVESIAVSPDGGTAVLGGFFSTLNRTPAVFAGQVALPGGTPVPAFDVQANAVVRAVGWADDDVFLGGGFTSVGSVRQPFLARLHASTGTLDTSFRPSLNEWIMTMEPDAAGTTLYVAGRFTKANGQARGRGAAFELPSGRLTAWDPGANEQVSVVLPSDDHVYLGGMFTALDGMNLHRFIARTNPSTGAPDPFWQPLPNGAVDSLADDPASNGVYIGGRFSLVGLVPRQRLALVGPSGVPAAFDAGSPAIVHSLDISPSGNLLYAAIGGTNDVGGNAVAAYETGGTGSVRWKHQGNGDVQVVHLGAGSTVYAGGHFRHMRSPQDVRRGIAAFDAPTGALKGFAPALFWSDLGVWDVEDTGDGLLVAGDQRRVGSRSLEGITRFPHQP